MQRSIVLILFGATLVASAILVERVKQRSVDADLHGVAMLRTRVDSVRALYASASTAADSARFKKELDERIYGVDHRQFHIPLRQETLVNWWTLIGFGTWLSVVGSLLMLLGIFFVRRTARAQRRD